MFHTQRVLLALSVTFLTVPVQAATVSTAESIAESDQHFRHVGSFSAFSEMVAVGVKKLALSSPMSAGEMDEFMPDAQRIAREQGVEIYREPELLVTDLFPSDVAEGKHVILIYKDTTLDEYLALKEIKRALVESGDYAGEVRREIARMFGYLLSYPDSIIEEKIKSTRND